MIYFTTYNGIITRKQINLCIENKRVNDNGRMEKKRQTYTFNVQCSNVRTAHRSC